MTSADTSTAERDPYRAMLRGGALPGVAVAAIALVVFVLVDGALGVYGSGLAIGLVLASSASTLTVLRRTAHLDPRIVFLAAMIGYVTKVGLLGVFLLLFRHASWLSPLAFAVTAIVVSLAWTTGEVIAFTRVRTLIYDEPTPEGRR